MHKINYKYLSSSDFFLFNIFPFFLGLVLILIYTIYFDVSIITLCDDGDSYTLYQLKVNLTLETVNYRSANVDYECLVDLHNQSLERPIDERDRGLERHMVNLITHKMGEMRTSLDKIHGLVARIREIEPGFRSPINTIRYPRVSNR